MAECLCSPNTSTEITRAAAIQMMFVVRLKFAFRRNKFKKDIEKDVVVSLEFSFSATKHQ